MKTVMVFDSCGEYPLKFYVLDGDYSHLNNVYINLCPDRNYILEFELNELLYTESGREKYKYLKNFPVEEVKQGAIVIVCGFAP